MKLRIQILFASILVSIVVSAQYKTAGADKLGWKLAVHTVCFNKSTLAQALDSINATGINAFIAYRGNQKIGIREETVNFTLEKKECKQVKAMIDNKGLTMEHFSVINVVSKEEWQQLFEFAKSMDVKMIISEPEYEHLPYVDSLAQVYKIHVGIHNHAVPSKYWHPQTAVSYIKKYKLSNYIGIYPDIENWYRSKLDPIEMLKLAEGKIIAIQLKDRYKGFATWGTGVINVSGILHELNRQDFKGVVSFEFFSNSTQKVNEIKESAEYFYRVANRLAFNN